MEKKITILPVKNVSLLDDEEKKIMDRLLLEYSKRIQRLIKNDIIIEAIIKFYNTEGTRKKYSFHVMVHGIHYFEADYSDWDLARTIHKTLNKLLNELEHRFHSSDQNSKVKGIQKKTKQVRL